MMTSAATESEAPLMLSVSGARGIIGRTMTPEIAARFAAAFGSYIRTTSDVDRPRLCLGRDSRPSGGIIADAAAAGLRSVGCDVIRLGIVTTPSVAVMIDKHGANGGMVITASHNPIQWNGIKCLNHLGVAPPPADAQRIIDRFQNADLTYVDVPALGSMAHDDTTHVEHVNRVLATIDIDAIRARRFKVVLDSVNGAGCVAGRLLLNEFRCEIIHINGEPTGLFAHTPEPTRENLTDLAEAVRDHDADVGFAQDPDADRLAIIDNAARYIGEEYTLVLCAAEALRAVASGAPARLAANLSTSRMIDDIAARRAGATVARTAVGEANVVAALREDPDHALIGGEGNGGVIWPRVCWVRDSLSAMALTLSAMADSAVALSAMVDTLPRYAMIKKKYDLAAIGGRVAIEPALTRVRDAFATDQTVRINDGDGVRIDWLDQWVHLRPSNTEPIIRLIAEAPTDEAAASLIARIHAVAELPQT